MMNLLIKSMSNEIYCGKRSAKHLQLKIQMLSISM